MLHRVTVTTTFSSAALLLLSDGALAQAVGDNAAATGIIAQSADAGSFIALWRVLVILIAVTPWLLFCQWVDRDTLYVRKLDQKQWDAIVLAGGVVGLAVWLLPPWTSVGLFWAGFGLWFLITVGTCGVYVAVRNSIVDPSSRVFTPSHIKKWFSQLGQKKEKKMEAVERVRMNDAAGKKVPVPDDPSTTDAFDAAQTLLFDALWRRATDVDLVVGTNAMKLSYRIDGVVTPRNDLYPEEERVEKARIGADFIKKVAGLEVEERRRPQAGEMHAQIAGSDDQATEIELKTSGTTQAERIAMRMVSTQNRLRLADLGLSSKQQAQLEELLDKQAGLMIVSGPRGSGVTSTQYAMLRHHDAFMQNLLTIEQQPLMDLENITQHTYDSTKHEGSYARQFQTVLRREPDVVMASDCVDRETAHLAVTSAKNKKIYMGMQAKDCFDALKKLISLAGDIDAVAETLLAVTSQRLVRTLCVACRVAYKPDAQLLKKANLPMDKIERFYRPPRPEEQVDEKGRPRICPNCQGSGYFGRTGLFEILIINDAIREQIAGGQTVNNIRATARKAGMLYLQEVGLQKVIEGTTGINEVMRVLRDE